ncbi:MAG: phosphatidate cytidylyltransferase, partial [Alphaproteobacteria bacterium]
SRSISAASGATARRSADAMIAAGMAEEMGVGRLRSETALRALSAVALGAPAAAAVILGPPFLPIFIGAMAVVMAWEWTRVTRGSGFGSAGAMLMLLLVAAVAAAAWGRFLWAFALVAAALPAVYAASRCERQRNAGALAAGALYIGVPALALLWLYARPEIGRALVVWLISIVIAADIAAYFIGRAVGGPKLAPRVSPGKTWSGAAGGVAGAVLAGLVLGIALELARPIVLAAAAVVFAIISQIGDLLESRVKRAFRVKDASGILPGHGGMMDRVDGIVAVLAAAALAIWIGGGDARSWL